MLFLYVPRGAKFGRELRSVKGVPEVDICRELHRLARRVQSTSLRQSWTCRWVMARIPSGALF